jgi:arylsulfate sulfotransferase
VSGVTPGTVVLGNALIDWDPQKGAVWTWSTFDHLDLTYAPNGLADWTHGNALIYSPDDGNLIFSMRNMNWVVKINYNNGAGDGSILWHLGPNGDFTLPPGQAPIEWNYGQHYPTIQSANSTGVFSLMFFNNGNNRLVDSNNDQCGSPGVTACYSSVPIFQLDEDNLAANVLWEYNLTPAYSDCCGDALVLQNGNVEFDVAMNIHTPNLSYIEEVTQPGQLVWRMNITGNLAYRGFRIPSLYPGVTWPANTQAYARSAPAQKRVFSGPKL